VITSDDDEEEKENKISLKNFVCRHRKHIKTLQSQNSQRKSKPCKL